MTTRTISLWLDTAMLLVFSALLSWRLTGVTIHEWVAVGLLVVLVVHLLIHWHWVETRVAQFRTGSARTRVNVLLNALLFVSMGVALVTGFLISKAILPNTLTGAEYLRWHSLHDGSSNMVMVLLGLHVALNWDLITSAVRRGLRKRAATVRVERQATPIAWPLAARRLVFIAAGALVVTVGTRAIGAALPSENRVTIISRDGHREERAAPDDIARMHAGDDVPNPTRGGARFVLHALMLGAVVLAGRKVLRLRLA